MAQELPRKVSFHAGQDVRQDGKTADKAGQLWGAVATEEAKGGHGIVAIDINDAVGP